MEKLIYEGKDITKDVEVGIAVYESIADNKEADSLRLEFATKEGWTDWHPQIGDTVEYRQNDCTTGLMFVYDFKIDKTYTTIYASPMPSSASSPVTKSKTWEKAYLSQIGSELAAKHGLSFELYNAEDIFYDIKTERKGQSDTAFLSEIAKREGAALIFYNKKILFANEEKLESLDAVTQLSLNGASFDIIDQDSTKYGSCVIKAGNITGAFTSNAALSELSVQGEGISNTAEAVRAAKGELRDSNKNTSTMTITTDLTEGLTAGICLTLYGDIPDGWEGKLYAYKVRHEFQSHRTVIALRRPLEGY